MIHTVTFSPYIEKRIRGKFDKNNAFHPGQVTYKLNGLGILTSEYLHSYKLENKAYTILGTNAISFVEDKLHQFQIMQTNKQTSMRVVMVDEEEQVGGMSDVQVPLEDHELLLFETILKNHVQERDVLVIAELEGNITFHQLERFYQYMERVQLVRICAFHPKYYPLLKGNPCNVLYVDVDDLYQAYPDLSNTTCEVVVPFIQENLLILSKLIVVALTSHTLLVFVDGKVYLGTYHIKDPIKKRYPEAVLAGIVRCYTAEEDIHYLLRECVSLSVGASLSSGLYVPHRDALDMMKENIWISEIT